MSNIEIIELTLKLSKLESLSAKFDDLQSEIEVLNSDQMDFEVNERDKIEQDIISNIAAAKNIIEIQNRIQRSSEQHPSHEAQCRHDHDRDLGFKLPQMQIPKFDGAYFRWLEFRDTFTSVVHTNARIPSIHKFHYLLSFLEGDAARVVSNLEVSADNYKEAWDLMLERYDNKRLLINHHLNSLFNIQSLTRESEKALRFLVDHVAKNLRALSSLGQPTDQWDVLLIFMICSKLDARTLMKWEEQRNSYNEVPTLEQFKQFLIDRADVLESLNRNKYENNALKFTNPTPRPTPPAFNNNNQSYNQRPPRTPYTKTFTGSNNNQEQSSAFVCIICDKDHNIYDCPTFKAYSMSERLADVKKYKLCINCLRQGHPVHKCRMGPCRECKMRHNSLLHLRLGNSGKDDGGQSGPVVTFCKPNTTEVLLSTALITVSNPVTKRSERVRALLDCGSQSSFITKSLKERLCLDSTPIHALNVIGIGNNSANKVVQSCSAQISSSSKSFDVLLSCFVLDELTGELPKASIDITQLNLPKNIQLADPTFYNPAPVDVLIGADVFWEILGSEQHSLGSNSPKLINSKLGWLISGPINSSPSSTYIHCNHAVTTNTNNSSYYSEIDELLTKFWQIEELPKRQILSESEKACEEHYQTHTTRLETGRFCVRLPLIDSPDCLGSSYYAAKKRLISLERRFRKDPDLKSKYVDFIKEYRDLGHLSASPKDIPIPSYFLCHHAVIKESSESTKLRVVFDGSNPSSSGYSVNDIQMIGPNMQNSLFSILIRARQYKYILTGDIEKMYRQVVVHEQDRKLQLILWREDESVPIKTWQLNTLTYGTASASYLSTRCLWQIGEESTDKIKTIIQIGEESTDKIKTIIQNDFYIDDLITGADCEEELRTIKSSVSRALLTGCFRLRKFKSNVSAVLEGSSLDNQDNLTISESSSTLGLGWNPKSDHLHFPISMPPQNKEVTKRFILSNSFKIFDPLGLLSPCIIQPKMLLQKLWLEKVDWDQPVPHVIRKSWDEFALNLPYLERLRVPRTVLGSSAKVIELHSFSDASQCAYGACIYMRSLDSKNNVTVKLLCAKSKVAPLKPTTIPRLELCAALLASKLCTTVTDSLRRKPTRCVHWCDSSVVLGWLNSNPSKLKTFVANRVVEILENTDASSWRYVPTAANPADLISRGVNASQLLNLELWWSGPTYLSKNEAEWPILNRKNEIHLPEIKTNTILTYTYLGLTGEPIVNFERHSSLNKLQRSLAYVKRFIYNVKKPTKKRLNGLSTDELDDAFRYLCKVAQSQSFKLEQVTLHKGESLNAKSKILSLSPFLDDSGLIRVGGRIDASNYTYEKRHPILLDSSHHLTKLIFEHEHLRNLHAGPQLLLSIIRDSLWPINGRHLARRTVHKCMRCRRLQGKTLYPKMGDLPSQRINPNFPFLSVGIDFAGPFQILNRKGRGAKVIKCYLCLFVCLRYKCLHLEAVGDLTKNSFIMTLRRFISRRGRPVEIFCDNGGNFVSAAKEINQFLKSNASPLFEFASQQGIKFVFSPAYAPHFGGIWEAGVKSAKHHIKRVMGNTHLTFEEISTLFAQVEAILNSRPLCPLSTSPDDFLSLSPGHFLIGRPLTALPAPALENMNENRLQRYARLEQIRQHFWQRWQREYISELQQRTKWKANTTKLQIGDLVLLQEDYVPPLCWRLGRVVRLFPGPDGISRVADIQTNRGCIRRPLVRLCPLPSAEDLQI